jgi:Tol biopolymer transport system component
MMNADGSRQTRLTENQDNDQNPAWSPDGEHIAFAGVRDGKGGLYVMNADGGNFTRLTATGGTRPSWSPDGRKIVYCTESLQTLSPEGARPLELFTVNADGSQATMLTRMLTNAQEPCWSPDGAKIVFVLDIDGLRGIANIFTLDADGRNVQRVTTALASDRFPAYSPDGKKIAFQSNRDGNFEIYLLNLE